MTPKHLTTQEACDLLRIHRATLYRWAREGKLSRAKPGRKALWPREQVEALIEDSTYDVRVNR